VPATARADLNFTPAVNDIGVYTLKDGRKFAVVAFVAGSPCRWPRRRRRSPTSVGW
jgi:beta-lactamase class A